MKQIKLTQGKYATVDDEDFEFLNQWKWCYKKEGYAIRSQHVKLGHRKYTSKRIWMHRLINETPKGSLTDHVNRNKLDNRRCNLRTGDKSLNSINRSKPKNNSSGYLGVSLDKQTNQWRAEIGINGKQIKLGRFNNIEDAIIARTEAEKKYHLI